MFRFYLHNGNQYYYINAIGNVARSTTKNQIATPIGWDETDIGWTRNIMYMGVFRSFSHAYQFVEDGAKILRSLYYKGDEPLSPSSSEAQCVLTVEKINPNTGVWETYFSGNIDFSKFSDSEYTVTANIMESGLNAYLDAYADTNFNFTLLPGTGVKIHLDGISLKAKYDFIPVRTDTGNLVSSDRFLQFDKNFGFVSREGSYETATAKDINIFSDYAFLMPQGRPISIGDYVINWWNDRYYLAARTNMVIENLAIRENLYIRNANSSFSSDCVLAIRLIVWDASRIVKQSQIIWKYGQTIQTNTAHYPSVNISLSGIQMEDGDRIGLFYEVTPLSQTNSNITIEQFAVDGNPDGSSSPPFYTRFDIAFRLPESEAQGERLDSLYRKICAAMSENTGTGQSSFLSNPSVEVYNNKPYFTIATSGDSLRNLTAPQPPAIRTSFSEFFKSIKSIYSLGFGIVNNVYRLEPLSFFLNKDSIIADLGEVKDLSIQPAVELMFNSFKIGYPDFTYDEVNGLDEFNTGHEYKMPIKTITKKEEFISNYRADAFGIETYRANLSQKNTVDAEQDNDTFIIEVENTSTNGAFKIRRQTGFISGVLYPSSRYNYGLTPKRNFWRNARLLSSVCRGLGSREITYQVSQKNNKLISSFAPFPNPPQIAESANVAINTLPEPLFLPVLFTFTCVPPDNIAALMATNPIGCFIFTYNGVQFKGFPMKVGTKPATWESYEMTLLATPDTDITQLIY